MGPGQMHAKCPEPAPATMAADRATVIVEHAELTKDRAVPRTQRGELVIRSIAPAAAPVQAGGATVAGMVGTGRRSHSSAS